MKLFEIESSDLGAVAEVKLTGGESYTTVQELEEALRQKTEKVVYYGDGVHRIAHTMLSIGSSIRVWKSGTGEIYSMRVGKNVRMVDIGDWGLDLRVDQDESRLDDIAIDGVINSSPTPMTTTGYRNAVYKSGAFRYAQNSKVGLIEAILSSARIPSKGFKPAYGGGLISSPADPNVVYDNVISYDIASSYPWSAATTKMPMGTSRSAPAEVLKKMKVANGEINLGPNKGFIGLFKFYGMKRNDWVRIPLIKTKDEPYTMGGKFDSLGMVEAEGFRAALSPADLKGLSIQYSWKHVEVEALEVHRLEHLPQGIIKYLGKLFSDKESKKGAARLRAKLAINTIIGLWGTDPFKSGLKETIKDGLVVRQYTKNLKEPWEKYTGVDKDGVTTGGGRCWDYRWAVYAVAEARLRIVQTEQLLSSAGLQVLYCDTDSIKLAGSKQTADYIFGKMNIRTNVINRDLGLPSGMGTWVDESAGYVRAVFRAKKFYANEDAQGKRSAFVSGLYKKDAESMIQGITLDDLALLDEVRINSSRPDFAEIVNDPFGAEYQEIPRGILFRYTKKTMLVSAVGE